MPQQKEINLTDPELKNKGIKKLEPSGSVQ